MLHIIDHFPIFAPELSSAVAGSAALLTGNTAGIGQPEKKATEKSNKPVSCLKQNNKIDELKDDCLAFRSYN